MCVYEREMREREERAKACSSRTRAGFQEKMREQKPAGRSNVEVLNCTTSLHFILLARVSYTAGTDSRAGETDLMGEGAESHCKGSYLQGRTGNCGHF